MFLLYVPHQIALKFPVDFVPVLQKSVPHPALAHAGRVFEKYIFLRLLLFPLWLCILETKICLIGSPLTAIQW